MSKSLLRKKVGWSTGRWTVVRREREAGMTTAEYAVGTLAAVAFAIVLLMVVRSGAVQGAVMEVITRALHAGA